MTRLLDLLERSLWTFVQAFAAAVVVTGKVDLVSLKIAAVAGAIAVAKTLSVTTSVKAGEAMVKADVPVAVVVADPPTV